ncbi:hypothetical protein MCOR25_009562 [Pyricularia grisea]|nr:hypothetical protein MCOR25_009562 [Pyricularia grisea]
MSAAKTTMAGTAAGHHLGRRRRIPDLVLDSEMKTSKLGKGCIQHASLEPPILPGDRFSKVHKTWYRKSTIVPGRVFLEECPRTAEVRAVKVLDAHLVFTEVDYARELEALAKFSRPKYAHCFVNSSGWYELDRDVVVVSMEYLPLGDLGRYLSKPLPELEARCIVEQLLEGLGYMHEAGFVHRNLTPENIMVAATSPRWVVKIGGFGCVTRDPVDVTMGCSINQLSEKYSAPELLRLSKAGEDAAYAIDMWSLGAITFRLLTGAAPFDDEESSNHLQYVLRRGRSDLQTWRLDEARVSKSAQDFILALMAPEAHKRLSAQDATAHQWFKPGSSSATGRVHVTPPQYVPVPSSSHQRINLSKIETDLTNLHLGTRTPSPARATTTRGSHTPDLKLTPDRYNTGNQGFVRPRFEYRHSGDTGEEWVGRIVNPFSPSEESQARQFPSPPPQPSTTPRPALHRQNSSKRKLSREPDDHPPQLQKRPSLKKTDDDDDDDDFATHMSTAGSSFGPALSATDRHGGYETCSETLVDHNTRPCPGPMAELWAIQTRFDNLVRPQCVAFTSARGNDVTFKEHARLAQELEQLLTDVDKVQGRRDNEAARAFGRRLVDKVQAELKNVDWAFRSGGWRWWDCRACKKQVRFAKGTRDGTYEVDSGEGTNMVVVGNPSYNCECGRDYFCLPCGLVQARSCKCYTKDGRHRGS